MTSTSDPQPIDTSLDDLLVRMPRAPYSTAYRGTRLLERRLDVDGRPDALVLREEVSADGTGAFRVELVDVVEAASGDPGLTRAKLSPRGPFNYHFRDPRVRDAARLGENYRIEVSPSATPVDKTS